MFKDQKPVQLYRALSSVSAAHTYGNAVAVIAKYIESLFPEGYFKYVHMSTKMNFKEFDFRKANMKEANMKKCPMLILRPRIILDDPDRFMEGCFSTTRFGDDFSATLEELTPFFEDKEKSIFVRYLTNRLSIEFDVLVLTETTMDQLNITNYIKNRTRWNMPQMLPTALESHVGKAVFDMISSSADIPIRDENGSIKRFLDYVNSHSAYPVTYKLKGSTGNDEFFRYYNSNIELTCRDLNTDEIQMRGMSTDTAQITFSVRTEFFAAGLYYFFTKNTEIPIYNDYSALSEKSILERIFTIQIPEPPVRLAEGFNLYTNSMFSMEDEYVTEDVTAFGELLNKTTKRIIDECNENGVPLDPFIHFEVMKDKELLIQGKDYWIDMESYELHTTNCTFEATYRLFIYVNTLYANNMIQGLLDAEKDIHNSAIDASKYEDTRNIEFVPNHELNFGQKGAVDNYGNLTLSKKAEKVNPELPNKVFVGLTSKLTMTSDELDNCTVLEIPKNTNFEVNYGDILYKYPVIAVPLYWKPLNKAIDMEGLDITNLAEEFIIKKKIDDGYEDYRIYKFPQDRVTEYKVRFFFSYPK